MKKTAENWFKLLPNKISKKAIKNTKETLLKLEFDSFSIALYSCFTWYDTPEGHNYWSNVRKKYQ